MFGAPSLKVWLVFANALVQEKGRLCKQQT